MAEMTLQFWRGICSANGEDIDALTLNDLEYRALGFLGYISPSLNNRRRDFYQDRTGVDCLTTATGRNVNDKGVQ